MRPFKLGVDYFPLDVLMDDKIELIEAGHGLIGFAIVIKLYQKIYASNYWIKWDKKDIIVFSKRINVDINLINACINDCLKWDIFNQKLFKEYFVLTSTGIQKRFFEITKRRMGIPVIKEYLLIKLPENDNIRLINVDSNSINASKSTQRERERESKKKVKNKEITYPKEFIKLWTDYPNTKGSKTQTFKNYQTTKKNLSPDQIYSACINSIKKQDDEKNEMYFQLSNLIGEKYRGDLNDLLNYKSPEDEAIRIINEKRQKKADLLNAKLGPAFGGPHGKANQ